jgi:hypothetical protein
MLGVESIRAYVHEISVEHLNGDFKPFPLTIPILQFHGEITARFTERMEKNVIENVIKWINVRNLPQKGILIRI